MSTTILRHVIVGFVVNKEVYQMKSMEWNCEHHFAGPSNFCPDCGKKSGRTLRITTPDWIHNDKFGACDIVAGYEYRHVIVGKKLTKGIYDNDDELIQIPALLQNEQFTQVYDDAKVALELLGIDPLTCKFGVWLNTWMG